MISFADLTHVHDCAFIFRQGLDQLESPATSVLHWHPNPVSDIIFSHDGKMICFFFVYLLVLYMYMFTS